MKLGFCIALLLLLSAGCLDGQESTVDTSPDTAGPGPGPSSQDSEAGGGSESSSAANEDINHTNSILLDKCQFVHLRLPATDAGFPFAAPKGWAGDDGLPDEFVYVSGVECGEASVFGVATLQNVSLGWIGHTNVSDEQGHLDGISYRRLQASEALFASPSRLVALLEDRNLSVLPGTVGVHDDRSFTAQFEAGRIDVTIPTILVDQVSEDNRVTELVVPRDSPSYWLSVFHVSDYNSVEAVGHLTAEGRTPLDPWISRPGSVRSGDAYSTMATSVEVQIHAA